GGAGMAAGGDLADGGVGVGERVGGEPRNRLLEALGVYRGRGDGKPAQRAENDALEQPHETSRHGRRRRGAASLVSLAKFGIRRHEPHEKHWPPLTPTLSPTGRGSRSVQAQLEPPHFLLILL